MLVIKLVVASFNEHLEERKEESLAISNRDKWRAKPIVRESAKSNETGKYLQDQEEDLLQNVQSLDISQKEISVQDQLKTSQVERGYQGSVQTTLNCYDGSPMKWLSWIGLYKPLLHFVTE